MNGTVPTITEEDRKRLEEMGIHSLDDSSPVDEHDKTIHQLRRATRKSALVSKKRVLTIVKDKETGARFCYEYFGVLPSATYPTMRRGWIPFNGEIIHRLTYDEVAPNEIGKHLVKFDDLLTPNPGLYQLKHWSTNEKERQIMPVSEPTGAKSSVLLFVHGTFSNTKRLLDQIAEFSEGNQFMRDAVTNHEVLLFDHRTVSVSPVLNALDLARAFGQYQRPVRVIAHSRGGLVTRWWLEAFDHLTHRDCKAVLVGCPLEGTSLAAPNCLRNGLDLIANMGIITGTALSLVPWGTVLTGLFKALTVVTSTAAKTPVIDAAIAMIPGLSSMSRLGNDNEELYRLNKEQKAQTPAYYAIQSNFRPQEVGLKIWRLFSKDNIANLAADHLVFPEENDLVVDTQSMKRLAGQFEMKEYFNFADELKAVQHGGSHVHHTNYFQQEKTIRLIRKYLDI